MEFDPRKSLMELWAASEQALELPDDVPEHLVTKPVRRLTPAELWYLIGHDLGLEHLVPLALEKLEDDPLMQAHTYPGDLLVVLMEARPAFWREQHALWLEVIGLLEAAIQTIQARAEAQELGEYMPFYLGDDFMGALVHFRGIHAE
ncbi:MAG: hypothetical protein HYV26_03610 [Candidatus Hydrogenedentes bacterium]|nr:hypothetical protein [Candidatus Hydrogenedentota bacterium]